MITTTLELRNAHLAGHDTICGRPVVVIETTSSGTPGAVSTSRYWIDTQTEQLLQYTDVTTRTSGTEHARVEIRVDKLALDELQDRETLSSDYFAVRQPPGSVLASRTASAITPASDFSLADVKDGTLVTLSMLRGKPVVLLFWGSWCPHCRDALPAMQVLYNEVGHDVEFISISSGPRDTAQAVRSFVQDQH
ncbi:MAG: TlpA family protein disulfide reductase, partial [Chloroflexota bacterium]|nr:TlpA family protein disulfide reductase [Chloroflexota bacterium]